jgi:hypothetical protein
VKRVVGGKVHWKTKLDGFQAIMLLNTNPNKIMVYINNTIDILIYLTVIMKLMQHFMSIGEQINCNSGTNSPSQLPLPVDLAAQQRMYRGVVIRDLLESERAHVAELRALIVNFLRPLKNSDM